MAIASLLDDYTILVSYNYLVLLGIIILIYAKQSFIFSFCLKCRLFRLSLVFFYFTYYGRVCFWGREIFECAMIPAKILVLNYSKIKKNCMQSSNQLDRLLRSKKLLVVPISF